MIRHSLSRRQFLRVSAATGASAFAVPAFLHARSANEKLNVAIIGPGGRGSAQLGAAGEMENVVAIADVDQRILGESGQKHPRAKLFADFRAMLSEMDKSIDAVMISTPDHTHAPAAAMSMRLGKHCYCEKPLTRTVGEARFLAQLAKEKNLVTQMGNQMHATDNFRRVVELVQAGAIGPVTEVRAWSSAKYPGVHPTSETPETPNELDWDLWIGPSPMRPYHSYYAPGNWRAWWDFGNGGLGDFGCHLMDLAFWALDLRHPTTVEAEGPTVDPQTCGINLTVNYEFPARGDRPPVRLTWYDGDKSTEPGIPPNSGVVPCEKGVLFIGREGMLQANYDQRTLYPIEKFKDYQPPAPSIPASIGHHREFFEACKTGGPTTCNFDYGGALTETVLLGTVAYRVGKKLEWNPETLSAANCPEADKLLSHPYREGWAL